MAAVYQFNLTMFKKKADTKVNAILDPNQKRNDKETFSTARNVKFSAFERCPSLKRRGE